MAINSKIKINMDALKTSKEWVCHKVKTGNNIFRVLPPFGDNSNGYPYRKWSIIWGLQDPESGRNRPYASPMLFEKRCPVTELVDGLRERLSKMEGELKARGLDDKALREHEKYARLSQFIRDYTPKTTYIYNAADKSGVIGLLELKATAHKEMKARMNEYIKDYNQDPTSLNSEDDDSGVWFNIKRDGEGFKTEYSVEKVQIKILEKGRMSFIDDRSALPEMVVQNFENLAYDLSSVYKVTTYDEVSEVLIANLDRMYEICPEANLSVEVNLDENAAPAPAARGISLPKAAPAGKVALRLQDEDDVAPVAKPTPAKVTNRPAPAPIVDEDDDFMAAADAILNG